jgi:hypothetical protein
MDRDSGGGNYFGRRGLAFPENNCDAGFMTNFFASINFEVS